MPDTSDCFPSSSSARPLRTCPKYYRRRFKYPVALTSSTSSFSLKAEGGNCSGNEIKLLTKHLHGSPERTRGGVLRGQGSEHHAADWVRRKMPSVVSHPRCFLPFLVRANKMAECLLCHYFIDPEDEVRCFVRYCKVICHLKCVKEVLGVSSVRKFKCPQHACFVCKKKFSWSCVLCPIASHDKCAPWKNKVIHLKNQPGKVICWRHPSNWHLSRKHMIPASDLEEVFCRLPAPYHDEEFKIDMSWKNLLDNQLQPPPYMHIRRNVYLIKKKRDDADAGCTNCKLTCHEDCVCRVQSISCSKACRCSRNCSNRPFRKGKMIKIVKTKGCGWGVEAAEPVSAGEFVIEYIGEVIDDAQCEERLWDMKHRGLQNFYMCEIRKDFTIDATFKGNSSRFLNHSCDPNCVLEKWFVDGEMRVGVFATRSIEVGEALTYDYRFVQFGADAKCHCGARNCRGHIASKKKTFGLRTCWGTKRKRTYVYCIEGSQIVQTLSQN